MAGKFTGSNKSSIGVPDQIFDNRSHQQGVRRLNGLYVGKVVDIADERYQQHIWVDIVGHEKISDKQDIEERHKFHKIRQMTPFGGTVQGSNYSNNYGSTWTPPSPGTQVLVAFTGQEQEGFLVGVLPDINRNAMVGGHPTSPDPDDGTTDTSFDHHVYKKHDGTRKKHSVGQAINKQGLAFDAIRGHGSSGARRESPSRVNGFNSPGGHSLVLDDGTEAYKEGINHVPDKNREEGKNNLLRLRSGEGAQILFNDTARIIYIVNQSGTGWVEIDDTGNIDVYAQSDVSVHAKNTINFYAGNEFNVDAESINIRARGIGGIQMESTDDQIQLFAQKDMRLTTKKNMHLRAGPHMKLTADLIDLNGPPALQAVRPTVGALAVNREVKESIADRVPEAEPWQGHLVQDSKMAAQAKSDPIDPDTTDFMLAGAGGGGGGSGSVALNPKRSAQQDSENELKASIYADEYVDKHFDRNMVGPRANPDSFDPRGRDQRNVPTTPTTSRNADSFDPRGPDQRNVPSRVPDSAKLSDAGTGPKANNANPRTRREWQSDVSGTLV